MANISIREIEPTLTGTYSTIVAAGSDVLMNKLMLRNSLTDRVRLRFDGNDNDTMTIEVGEKITIGGFAHLKGKLVEGKTETSAVDTFRLNTYN